MIIQFRLTGALMAACGLFAVGACRAVVAYAPTPSRCMLKQAREASRHYLAASMMLTAQRAT